MAAIVAARDGKRDGMQAACDAVFSRKLPPHPLHFDDFRYGLYFTLLGLMGTIYGLIYTFDALPTSRLQNVRGHLPMVFPSLWVLLFWDFCAVPLLVIVFILNLNSERLIQEMEASFKRVSKSSTPSPDFNS